MKRKLLPRAGNSGGKTAARSFRTFLFSRGGRIVCLTLGVLFLLAGSGCLWVESLLSKISFVPIESYSEASVNEAAPESLSEVASGGAASEPETSGESQNSEAAAKTDPVMEYGTGDILSDPQIQNILLIGSDTRGGETYGRSDTMMVLSLNHKTNSIRMLSFLRDLYVKIDGYQDTRLNAAFAYGGPKLLIGTLEKNFRFGIDNYISIDFQSFEKTIDILGGVQISLTQAEADEVNKDLHQALVVPGMNTLNGTEALSYARIREIDSDFQRTGRQRKVITAVLSSLKQSNPITLLNLANSILPLIRTNLDNSQLVSLIYQAPSLLNGSMSQLAIPANDAYYSDNIRGMDVLVPDIEANKELIWQFLYNR